MSRIWICTVLGIALVACGHAKDVKDDAPTSTPGYTWRLHENTESLVFVSWPQETPGSVVVEYELDGNWVTTPSLDAPAGTVEKLIVGIPFETEANWRVIQEDGSQGSGPPIITGLVPDDLPVPTVTISNPTKWLPEHKYLLSSINQDTAAWASGVFWTYIMDRQGRIVWANETPLEHWTLYAQVAVTRDRIIYDEATRWTNFDRGKDSQVHFVYLDEHIRTVKTPGLHHAFVQLPDGTLAWGSKYHDGIEAIVERKPDDKNETIIWTIKDDWISVSDSLESNCLFYDVSRNTYLYSFYSNDTVLEVDREAGTTLWWAGNANNGYTFMPEDSRFDWQHGVSYTNSGTLLVSTKASVDSTNSTLLREYSLDHKQKTLTEIWSYNSGVHARYNGDAWRLENGNTLHIVGSAGHIIEVDESGTEIWRLEFPEPRMQGRGEFISDLYALVSPAGRIIDFKSP